jgi:hypothetical protein
MPSKCDLQVHAGVLTQLMIDYKEAQRRQSPTQLRMGEMN